MSPVLIWFFTGLALVLLEFAVPGVILVFFGIAAWVVTALAWSGVVESTAIQLMVFITTSLALLFGLRRWVKGWFMGDTSNDRPDGLEEIIGKPVRVMVPIPGGPGTGKIELKGAQWQARSDTPLAAGTLATVISRDGLVLQVKPI